MTTMLILGAVFGLGVAVLVLALSGTRQTLLGQLLAVDNAQPVRPTLENLSWRAQFERWVRQSLSDRPILSRIIGADLRSDLAVLNLEATPYVARKVVTATAMLIVAPLLLGVLARALGLPVFGGVWMAFALTFAVYLLPDQRIRAEAKKRREELVSTLCSYLDLVALRAASGSGASEALRDASHIGTGYGWTKIRTALQDARLAGQAPAVGLSELGRRLDVPELVELASQLALVDDTGAQTEATLRSKADALRARERTALEGDAKARSSTMFLGQVALAMGFLILIGYPALMQVLSM